jgi:neutral ceramidase
MKNTALRFAIFLFSVGVVTLAPGAAAVQHGSLRAGAARVDITPPVNPEYPPSGKYAHEKLYIRAIVLDNGVTRGRSSARTRAASVKRSGPSPPNRLPGS